MATVALCTPHGAQAFPDYYRCIMEMQQHFLMHTFIHVEIDTMIVSKARNALVEASRGAKAEVIWFIDNDTLVPPDAGILVDQALKLEVVSGVYFNRRPPYAPQVYERAVEAENAGMYWPLLEYPPSGLREEHAIGAGCVCVRMDVFEKLEKVWGVKTQAAWAYLMEQTSPVGTESIASIVKGLSPWFEFLEKKGEDLYFSERLVEAGIPIWVNWDVKCEHIGYARFSEGHFQGLYKAGLIKKIGKDVVLAEPPPEGVLP